MAIRNLGQQQGRQGQTAAVHVWSLHHAASVLDSRSTMQVPQQAYCTSKIDVKSAYRICHLNAITAIKNITQLTKDELCIIMLCLIFGGAPCPFEWNIISESIRNLANSILHNDTWDPTTLFAPYQHLVPAMILMNNAIPFAEGAKQIVYIPIDPRGTGDI